MQTPDCEKTLPEYIKINSSGCYTMESIDVFRCSVLSSLNKDESKYCGKTSPSSVAHFLSPFLKVDLYASPFLNGRFSERFKWHIVCKCSEFSTRNYSANYQSTYHTMDLHGMTLQLLLCIRDPQRDEPVELFHFIKRLWGFLGPGQVPSILERCL